MARNPEDDADSGATILLDVKAKSIAVRRRLETGFNTGKGIAIDERSNMVAVYVTAANGNAAVTYDFNLIPDKESLYNYYVNSLDCSPYVRNEAIEAALDEVGSGLSDWREAREKIYPLLEAQKVSLEMSHYQLALTYKRLGDLLAERGEAQEAALAYETGLVLNPKLSVKKALKKIYKDFPDMEKPTPRVYSVEREMAWAQEPYELPSTYTPKEGKAQADGTSYRDTETYKNLTGSDKELADGMADFLHGLGQTFMDGLKTEAYRFAESIEGLEEMSDVEFSDLFNALCKHLEPPQRAEARRTAEIRISERQKEPALTVRQLIVMDVYNMVKSYTGESIEY
ncbi:MAG: hypothetical protein LUE15_07695 [Oscillospiraceae bacterium]|nr:hypothetical protein [Oscillospiraceae bacterium]